MTHSPNLDEPDLDDITRRTLDHYQTSAEQFCLPGSKVQISPVKMDFSYGTTYSEQSPEAYERLMLDVMAGDATLFMRRDAVETSWSWVMNIFEGWEQNSARALPEYSAGSSGPIEADRLLGVSGRAWRPL